MSLLAKIESRSAVVGVIGLGYVGLPLLAAFHKAGFPVLGFDVDPRKIEMLHRGENYLKHLGKTLVADMVKAGRFDATADMSRLGEADAIIVCVPTPLGKHLEPDVGYIEKAADDIARTLRPGQVIALESSTYPRTTREVMLPRFEAKGLKCGVDFFLAFSPEREDPGRKDHNTQSIPKLVGGIDKASGKVAVALYRRAIQQIIPVSSAEVAEAAKLLENIYRSVNIALVNELKMVLTEMGIDVWEVIEAAKTKPFGFQAFYPGPGLGGHCLAGNEFVFVHDTTRGRQGGLEAVRLDELFERHAAHSSYEIGEVEATDVRCLEALSVDPATGHACLAPVTQLFRRPSPTPLLKIRLCDNRTLTVTDGHPMLVHEDERIVVRQAEDLSEGDEIVLMASWPEHQQAWSGMFDLLETIEGEAAVQKTKDRIMLREAQWRGQRPMSGGTMVQDRSYATAAVATIERVPAEAVYSMEVEGTHTFVTSYGIAVHNCIPIDPYYLTWKAREVNMPTRFIELAGEVNRHMPEYVVGRVAQALNDRSKSVKGAKVLVLGLAYKPDIDDVRESPSFELIEELEHMGAHVDYNDPLVPQTHYMRRWGDIGKKSVELSPESLRSYDCVIISTHHSAYDWQMVADCSPLIVDTRNALAKTTGRRDHIVKA